MPYFMVHRVEPIFPFNLTEGTFLVALPDQETFSTMDLVAWRVCQLQKHQQDLNNIKEKVLKAHYQSICNFEQCYCCSIVDYDFKPGAYILVRNSMAELDGAVSKLHYAAFRLLPYLPCNKTKISVISITGLDEEVLNSLASENVEKPDDEAFNFDFNV
jgi:hypothetical protein